LETRTPPDEIAARYAAIVASSDDAIVGKDLDGYITSWNPAAERIYGYTSAEAVGRHITMIIPEERRSEEDMVLGRIRRGESVDHFETVRVARDGRRFTVSLTVSPIKNAAGEIIGASKIARDVTERAAIAAENAALLRAAEQARAEAEEASRAKDEFLAMLGHELRNPLAPIATALSLIKHRSGALDREHAVIERQVKHMTRLVDDLMDVARVTRGKVALALEPTDVAEAVDRAVETASPLLEERRHRLTTNTAAGLVVRADPARLGQVITNLLHNAARYTDPGGHIEVGAARDGDAVTLWVKDDGHGIAPDLLPRVFDPFVQGRQALDRARGGLGLGLALVRSLVELHGGSVSVESEGPGRGSRFEVRLPAAPPEASVPPPDLSARWGALRAAGARVLVVDDNADGAELLGEMLSLLGFESLIAYDGPGALALAEGRPIDLAVLDIGLPGMDGYELARRLRALDGYASVKLIALTGYGRPSDRARSREAGFDAHLVKPVGVGELRALVEQLLGAAPKPVTPSAP